MPTKQAAVDQDGPPGCQSLPELKDKLPLSDEAKALVEQLTSPSDFLRRLLEEHLEVDAIRVLAYTLPIRKSVWWTILCTWHGVNGSPDARQDRAVRAAVHWVLEPTSERRRSAEAEAQSRPLEDATDCCVRAASLAGQVNAPEDPFVPGTVAVAARMVVAGVFLAYAQRAEADPTVSYRRFARLGCLVGEGKIPWTELQSSIAEQR
jgi:hypothetical protein